ncbi:MAG TPA: hypothetical protein VHU40_05720, partial [Polyangia bacterium]|nr:hypothetical protein [Polyangia bacterium]
CTAGPPWYLGTPLSGRPAIPAQSRALTVAEHRRAVEEAHRSNQQVIELSELEALEARGALRPEDTKRLLELLTLRTRDWVALRRPLALVEDLRHIIALAPAREHLLAPRLALAEVAAGDVWLGLGENARAEQEYGRADKRGASGTDFRFRAVWRASVADLDLPTIERALSELPERVLTPFSQQYLDRGGDKPRLLARAWRSARRYGPPELLSRLEALSAASDVPFALEKTPVSPAGEGGEGGPTPIEPAADDRLLAGPTLARVLLPAAARFPQILDPSPRSRLWAERLLTEDPTSPDSLELAALIDARAGRDGGAARKLTDLVFYSADRAQAYGRAARVWEKAGRPRLACASWAKAARLGPRDDPAWCQLKTCLESDPGAGDAAAVASHIKERAPGLPCVAPEPPPPEEAAPVTSSAD